MPGITLIHFIRVSGNQRDDRTPHAVQYHFAEPLLYRAPCPSGLLHAVNTSSSCSSARHLGGLGALGAGGGASAETVGELAVDGLEVAHAAGTGGLPALSLLAPVDCAVSVACFEDLDRVLVDSAGSRTLPGLSSRVAARRACVLLDVEGATTCCPSAEFSVRRLLVCRTLPLYLSQGTTGMTYRNACRACASCCDAFRNWRYPLLHGCQSRSSVSAVPSRQMCGVLILNGGYHSNCQYVCAARAGWVAAYLVTLLR